MRDTLWNSNRNLFRGQTSVDLSSAEIALIERALSDYEKLRDHKKSAFLSALIEENEASGKTTNEGERDRLIFSLCKGLANIRSDDLMIDLVRRKLLEASEGSTAHDSKQLGLNLREN